MKHILVNVLTPNARRKVEGEGVNIDLSLLNTLFMGVGKPEKVTEVESVLVDGQVAAIVYYLLVHQKAL